MIRGLKLRAIQKNNKIMPAGPFSFLFVFFNHLFLLLRGWTAGVGCPVTLSNPGRSIRWVPWRYPLWDAHCIFNAWEN